MREQPRHNRSVLLLISPLFVIALAWALSYVLSLRPVIVPLGDLAGGGSDTEPMHSLSSSLTQHPQANQFNIGWIIVAGGKGWEFDLVYNRSEATLKCQSEQDGTHEKYSTTYYHMTDQMIHKVAHVDGSWQNVLEYGASKQPVSKQPL